MKKTMSIRSKLIILYLITVIIPVVIIIFVLPYYYKNLFVKQTTLLSEGTLTSLTRNVEMYLDDLERLTITPYLNDDVMTALKLKASDRYGEASEYSKYMAEKAFRQTLPKQFTNPRQDILGTILLPEDGSVYVVTSVDSSIPVPNYAYKQQSWYQKALEKDGNVAYISKHKQDYLERDPPRQVFSISRLIKDPDSGKPLGVIMADAANIVLEKIIGDVKFNVTTIIAVLDENKQPLYSNYPLKEQMRLQLVDGKVNVADDGDTYRVVIKTMEKSGWSIAVLFSNREFESQLTWIYLIGAIFAAGGTLLTLFLNISLTQWIIKPFRDMVHVMKSVQRGNWDRQLVVRGKDETAQLGMTLNMMITQLKDMIDREYRAVLGQRNAEYRALQAQIQPHFLYNTLNGFIGLNRSGQSRLLENAILSLSSMLRYMLEHQDMATVKEEIAFLQKYGDLQRIRFGEKLTVTIDVDPRTESIRLPKLLLQPLVENAIIHGIEPLKREGSLLIQVRMLEESEGRESLTLQITIVDNGVGFDTDKAAKSVGITNVQERLLIFQPAAQFNLHSVIHQGTSAEILIPCQEV
ncbi:sensor histidine kinase [Paenibacillus sp. GCM10027628]|uniref:cache domain-containing sensor histidine kinase n=1 Tax=Paenibacillus sp. GCM10027628 TaxID=3273413 RepID=UPI003636174C